MKKTLIAGMTTLSLLMASLSYAQWNINWQGSGKWGPDSSYVQMFSLKTVNIFRGTVLGIDRFIPAKGMYYGIMLKLKTDRGPIDVLLGPAWYVENQDFKIIPNDAIEVIGSKLLVNNKPLIVATEVSKGNTTMKLRDPNGFPLWCAWRTAPQKSDQSSQENP